MTSAQAALYRAALQIGRAFGTGGATWGGVRGSGSGVTSARTFANLAPATGYFLDTQMMRASMALPNVTVYSEPYVWVTSADTDTEAGDVRSDGTIAFLVKGAANVSQGFALVPADLTTYPQVVISGPTNGIQQETGSYLLIESGEYLVQE